VQFTACQEYVDLVERARDLLSHAVPGRSLEEVHLRAMRLLVAELEKRKFAVGGAPRQRAPRATEEANEKSPDAAQPDLIDTVPMNAHEDASKPPGSLVNTDAMKTPHRCHRHRTSSPVEGTVTTTRYVPAPVRREVYARDGGRCAFRSADGMRCRETRFLELHHFTPYARNGATTADNLALYCRAHNALAAEGDFGHAFMVRRSGREFRPLER
jgi:hypothetical protein